MKKNLLVLLLIFNSITSKAQEKMKIIYVYDALCGWCYGFAPEMNQFQEKYQDSLSFEVISGGMITGNRIGPIGEVASYIASAYKVVENATSVKFGDEFLNKTLKNGEAIFTSIPSSIALAVFKKMDPKNSIQFASELQKAIYFDGCEPEDLNVYGRIAAKFGQNSEDFILKMKDPSYLNYAEEDFEISSNLGVTGFPTVFLEVNGVHHRIASGFVSFKELENNYLTFKNKKQ